MTYCLGGKVMPKNKQNGNGRDSYIYVNLPKKLVNRIDNVIQNRAHGYSSRAEFVKDAVREKLQFFQSSLSRADAQ
jgi:metal-responsive CopG/Arc/MetJ family transcriptional regulator